VRETDELLRPWAGQALGDVPGLRLCDVHTHIGANDPDGFRQTPEELLQALDRAQAAGVVFPMHEPSGYAAANDRVLALAQASAGRLTAFCRVDPRRGAVAEARRCLDAGARGIKLHPRAEGFALAEPAVRELFALAQQRRAPILIHAGRGIPALGRDSVALAREFPEAPLILAHCAISDLAWIWRELQQQPNLYVDTAWWSPADLMAVFALVPPGQVLWASDSPYGSPVQATALVLRCALQAGLSPQQLQAMAGGQARRLVAGQEPLDLGPAPGPAAVSRDPLLERAGAHLLAAVARRLGYAPMTEPVALVRLACEVAPGEPRARHFASVLELLELLEQLPATGDELQRRQRDLHLLITALAVAMTPDVGVPG